MTLGHVRKGADRQSRRDRAAHSPRLSRDGDQDGRRAFDGRCACDACAARRRDRLHRPAAGARQLSQCRDILSAASITGADAIHPGLGFLAENADFAAAVEETGFTFIGPSPEHIRLMGDKVRAKAAARRLGIPVVPGSPEAVRDIAEAEAAARDDRLSGAAEGVGRRRRARHEAGARRGRAGANCCRWRRPRRRPGSATIRSISNAISTGRGISRCSCSATARATSSISASATARCSARTRRSSKRPRRRRSTAAERASGAGARGRRRCASSAIKAPARWSFFTRTAHSISSR